MKKQILSFKNALRGIYYTIKSESHMRFHMVAAFYVILFSMFYNFSPAELALLFVLIALVMAAEVINTCIEELCNLTADRYEPIIRFAKDAAAGAVLILSAASVAVALIFFIDIDVILNIISFFVSNPLLFAIFILSACLSAVFVALGPVGIKNKLAQIKKI